MLQKNKTVSLILLTMMFLVIISLFSPKALAEGEDKGVFDGFDVNFSDDGKLDISKPEEGKSAWGTLIEKYKGFITGVAAVGAVTMVVLFIVQFLKLGASAGNPKARSEALVGVLWTGIAAAGLGAVALITGIFYNAVDK